MCRRNANHLMITAQFKSYFSFIIKSSHKILLLFFSPKTPCHVSYFHETNTTCSCNVRCISTAVSSFPCMLTYKVGRSTTAMLAAFQLQLQFGGTSSCTCHQPLSGSNWLKKRVKIFTNAYGQAREPPLTVTVTIKYHFCKPFLNRSKSFMNLFSFFHTESNHRSNYSSCLSSTVILSLNWGRLVRPLLFGYQPQNEGRANSAPVPDPKL